MTNLEILDQLPEPEVLMDMGRVEAAGLTPELVLEALAEKYDEEEEFILGLPSQEEGLDMTAVNNFCEKYNFVPRPVKVLSPEDFQRALEKLGGSVKDSIMGRCLDLHDLVIVMRDHEAEELNGPGYTESLIVHE